MTRTPLHRIVRAIDLDDDADAIAAYERAHSPGHTPAAVLESHRRHGIADVTIYRFGSRLVMVMEVTNAFDPDALEADARADPVIADWHRRMAGMQRPLAGETGWAEMHCVFRQSDHD